MTLFLTSEIRERLDLFSTLINGFKNLLRLNLQRQCTVPNEMRKISRRRPRSVEGTEPGQFYAVSQRTAKKCSKSYNARAQLLFCSLYNTNGPLFGDPQNVLHNENHEKFQHFRSQRKKSSLSSRRIVKGKISGGI